MPGLRTVWWFFALATVAMAPATVLADDVPGEPAPPEPDPNLDADAVYERVLDNRRYLEGTKEAGDGILSRTLARYHEPSDVRGTGYLVGNKDGAPNDQFIYLPSLRRTRRLNLRTESVAGTDLSVEDIIPRELDDAEYRRAPDAVVEDTPCYVIEAIPAESASAYSRAPTSCR